MVAPLSRVVGRFEGVAVLTAVLLWCDAGLAEGATSVHVAAPPYAHLWRPPAGYGVAAADQPLSYPSYRLHTIVGGTVMFAGSHHAALIAMNVLYVAGDPRLLPAIIPVAGAFIAMGQTTDPTEGALLMIDAAIQIAGLGMLGYGVAMDPEDPVPRLRPLVRADAHGAVAGVRIGF